MLVVSFYMEKGNGKSKFSTIAWKILTDRVEPGRLQSMRSQRAWDTIDIGIGNFIAKFRGDVKGYLKKIG